MGGEKFQQGWKLLWHPLAWRGEYALLLLLRVDTRVSTWPLFPLPVEQNPRCPFRPPVLLKRRGAPSQQGKAGHLSSLFTFLDWGEHETLVLGPGFVFYVCSSARGGCLSFKFFLSYKVALFLVLLLERAGFAWAFVFVSFCQCFWFASLLSSHFGVYEAQEKLRKPLPSSHGTQQGCLLSQSLLCLFYV